MANYFSHGYFSGATKSNYGDYTKLDNDGFWSLEIEWIKKYKIGGKILDVGCAYGYLLKRVAPYFSERYGVDVSQEAVKRAKNSAPGAMISLLNIEQKYLPLKSKYFDLVIALEVLEHMKSLSGTLNKINRLLMPGGYLIASLPIKGTWVRKLFGGLDRDKSHIGIPSENDLIPQVHLSGFTMLEKKYFVPLTCFKLPFIPAEIEIICRKVKGH